MDEVIIKSPAKINLSLDILGKRADNYHDIETVMHKIELHDMIKIEDSDEIRINCNYNIPLKQNLVLKAVKLLKERYGIKRNVSITMEKNIPIGAGLGGGSSNAALALIGLNKLWNLNLKQEELAELAKEIGSDVPFFITGNAAYAKGRGELLERIEPVGFNVLLVNPGFEISTKEAYENLDLSLTGKKLASRQMLKCVKSKNIRKIAQFLHNDFESFTLAKYPVLKEIKDALAANGALNAVMSGSGPTIFGIFEDEEKAKGAYERLKGSYDFVFLTKTLEKNES